MAHGQAPLECRAMGLSTLGQTFEAEGGAEVQLLSQNCTCGGTAAATDAICASCSSLSSNSVTRSASNTRCGLVLVEITTVP
jgi:hypothetical protein